MQEWQRESVGGDRSGLLGPMSQTRKLGDIGMTIGRRKTALVAGAAGFLGSNLVDRLLAHGYEVVGLDNLQTGRMQNLSHLHQQAAFRFIEADIVNPIDLAVDLVFNLACPASPPRYQSDPVRTMKTCVLGTLMLLELASRHNATFVQASTSEVYGDPLEHPQRETYWGHVNPIGIRSCYDEGKRAAETLCFDFKRSENTDVRVARIFNTYGPRMDPQDGRVVSNFVMQALQGAPITIYGDGSQSRSFCYVDDLVTGLVALAQVEACPDGPINLGNPHEFSMLELAEKVLAATHSRSELKYEPLPSDDPRQRQPDIARARTVLKWHPEVSLQAGLAPTIAYFRSQLDRANRVEPLAGQAETA
jgi:UDP-glucuronate decarboxylase